MSRLYCQSCLFPLRTCLCDSCEAVFIPLTVMILQHPKEVCHPKNTARLAKLLDPNIQLLNTEDSGNTSEVLSKLKTGTSAVLYPSDISIGLENYAALFNTTHSHKVLKAAPSNTKIDTLILLDGSWRQAYALYMSFDQLKKFHHFHFDKPPSKQYAFRCSKKSYQLSTIEALAYALKLLANVDSSPFLKILAARRKFWQTVTSSE